MANDNHKILDKDTLLSVLARKMGTPRQEVEFLFGKTPPADKSIEIPGFRETLRGKY